jgi:hypothetical protein
MRIIKWDYAPEANYYNIQRLPGGLVSNVIPLDLPKVVGACERLH